MGERGILVDPRLVLPSASSPGASALAAFRMLTRLFSHNALSFPIRCLTLEHLERAKQYRNVPAAKAEIIRFLTQLIRYDQTSGYGSLAKMPDDLPNSWREALNASTRIDDEGWRTPCIVVSKSHATDWPSPGDVNVRTDAGTAIRRLVFLEETPKDAEFWHDVDPWKFRCDCAHGPLEQGIDPPARTQHLRCLPCPPGIKSSSRWTEVKTQLAALRARDSWYVDGVSPKAFFIPSPEWEDAIDSQSDWRSRRIFNPGTKMTVLGQLSGPKDHKGRIWVWSQQECHWDVQHEDPRLRGTYWNVLPDGAVQKKVEEGRSTRYPV